MSKRVTSFHAGELGDSEQERVLTQIQHDSPSMVGLFKRVYLGTTSPRQCIRAHCLACCWFDEDAIRNCMASSCTLWKIRPYQRKGNGGAK